MMKKIIYMIIVGVLCFALSACGDDSQEDESYESSDESMAGVNDDVDEYGLLSSYDTAKKELVYTPIEIVEESDTERIKELEKQGVELEFPNGYFVYQLDEVQLSIPVSKSVSISLLNDEFTLEESSMDAVLERLEGHPSFFLCKLHISQGCISEIKEHFVP